MLAVIAENDESQWRDDTGTLYHFPRRYEGILTSGTQVIYYKGKMKDKTFINSRLSPQPHYFGMATIGSVYLDTVSKKGDLFATIQGFQPFIKPVSIKSEVGYYEEIPENRKSNYWRDGARVISADSFAAILMEAGMRERAPGTEAMRSQTPQPDDDFESGEEGSRTLRYLTTYERDPRNRKQAIAIHGLRCKACDLNMGERYGPDAEGLIHVHHVVPISTYDAPRKIDPATELVPVCPNCHAVIHRKKTSTLSISDLRAVLAKNS